MINFCPRKETVECEPYSCYTLSVHTSFESVISHCRPSSLLRIRLISGWRGIFDKMARFLILVFHLFLLPSRRFISSSLHCGLSLSLPPPWNCRSFVILVVVVVSRTDIIHLSLWWWWWARARAAEESVRWRLLHSESMMLPMTDRVGGCRHDRAFITVRHSC